MKNHDSWLYVSSFKKGHIPKLSPIVSTSKRLDIVFFTQNINLRSDASILLLLMEFVGLFLFHVQILVEDDTCFIAIER